MITHLHIHPISAFKDNYIWVIHNQSHAVVVDPGEAEVVIAFLEQHGLTLCAILITHHHADHVGGNEALTQRYKVPVYGPAAEIIPCMSQAVREGNTIELKELALTLQVFDIPGHTAGHIAYYTESMVFCGDTLFGCGCGRLFEGTAAQMYTSLSRLGRLPPTTRVYCAHEYTLSNIAFALHVEPDNADLLARAATDRDHIAYQQPTLPSSIALELATNPFLRCHLPHFHRYAQQMSDQAVDSDVDVFSILRTLKNKFA